MDEPIVDFGSPEHIDYLEQQLDIGLWVWRLTEDRLVWSAGLFRILGLSPNSVAPSFELYRSVVHPHDQLDFSDKLAVATTGRLAHRRFRIIRPTGELRWIESHGQLLYGNDGQATQMIGFARDITDIKAHIDTSAAHQSVMRAIRELTGARIWRTAEDGTVVADAIWWQMVDRSHAPGHSGSPLEDIHPEDVSVEREAWAEARKTKGVYRSTFRVKQPNGSYGHISSVSVPVTSDTGEALGWMGVSKAADLPAPIRYLEADEVPPALFRAARGYLDLPGEAFAAEVGVSYSTIRRLESADTGASKVGLVARQQVLDFLAQRGVRLTSDISGIPQMSITRRPEEPIGTA